jgi:hypothetical protein
MNQVHYLNFNKTKLAHKYHGWCFELIKHVVCVASFSIFFDNGRFVIQKVLNITKKERYDEDASQHATSQLKDILD